MSIPLKSVSALMSVHELACSLFFFTDFCKVLCSVDQHRDVGLLVVVIARVWHCSLCCERRELQRFLVQRWDGINCVT